MSTPHVPHEQELVRAFGVVTLTAAIINIIVGGGIFRLPAAMAGQVGGFAPAVFAIGALVMIPIALCFAAAGSRATMTGGAYSYAAQAFGPLVGFLSGALLWFCNVSACGGVAAALADQAARLVPELAAGPPRTAFLVAVLGTLATLNVLGVVLGARAIATLATLKLAPLFLLAFVGLAALPFLDTYPLSFALPPAAPLGAAMLMAIFAYSGMETALAPSGEVKDPSRTIPRATVAATLIVVFLYVSLQAIATALLGPKLPDSLAPLADAASRLWPPALLLLLATAGVSMLGFLQGTLLGSPRVVYALARDGFLPRVFARIGARRRTPYVAILFHAVVSLSLAISGDFAGLVLISSGASCLLYAVVCAAAWHLDRRDVRGHGEPFRLPAGPLFPLIGVLAMVAVLTTLTAKEWLAIGVAVGALMVLYGVAVLARRGDFRKR